MPVHVGQAKIATGVAVGELFVVEAEQVQEGGVEIVNVHAVVGGEITEFIGGAMDNARSHAAGRTPAASIRANTNRSMELRTQVASLIAGSASFLTGWNAQCFSAALAQMAKRKI